MVNAHYVTWARRRGYRVNTWTVDEPDEMRRLIGLGVDSIITNIPDTLRNVLETIDIPHEPANTAYTSP